MNKGQIISICQCTMTEKIHRLVIAIKDNHETDGVFPYPEAEGTSRAPFGHTGIYKNELKLAEIAEKNTPAWEDITYEAIDKYSDYTNENYVERIAMLNAKKTFKQLSEEEKQMWSANFYELWNSAFDFDTDESSPCPWGCPWEQGSYANNSVQPPKTFFEEHRDEIKSLKEQEVKEEKDK